MPAYYLTGTDTGAGKTQASCALLWALREAGHTAVGMKPVASGCERTAAGWRNDDALALLDASSGAPDYAQVNPYALPDATAPEIAAAHAGIAIEPARIISAFDALQAQAEWVLVEGVGGWLAPLAAGLEQADIVRALRLPVILVVGLKLGCINHARLSVRAIEADGVELAGWLASDVDPELAFADEYFAALAHSLPQPCLGRLGHADTPRLAKAVDALTARAQSLRPGL